MYAMKMQKMGVKRKRSTPRRTPELMEEIVMDILMWLPVKSLLRFKSVCKAWRAIINDPMFIQAHLRHSASKWEQGHCFIISPHTIYIPRGEVLPYTSNRYLFHQLQLQCGTSPKNNVATFLHAKDFSQQSTIPRLAHCDGLVLSPTNTRLYLFNPATRDAITLPDSFRTNLWEGGRASYHCLGLGLDPCTGKYKVVQAFFRSMGPDTKMGMEVFTIGGDDGATWREIMSDPPCPAERFQIAVYVSGFMFWRLAETHLKLERGFLHLSLEEEEFGITGLPDELDTDEQFMLAALHGRDLCVTAHNSNLQILYIWILPIADESLNTLWQWRYSIEFSGLCRPIALPPFSNGIVLLEGCDIYSYDLATSEVKTLCELHRMRFKGLRRSEECIIFRVEPFMESLVRITY